MCFELCNLDARCECTDILKHISWCSVGIVPMFVWLLYYNITCNFFVPILRFHKKNEIFVHYLVLFWFQGIPPNGKLLSGNGPRFIDPDLVCVFDRDCDSISYCRGFRCEVTWWFILIMVLLVVFIIGLVMFGVMWCLGYCRR